MPPAKPPIITRFVCSCSYLSVLSPEVSNVRREQLQNKWNEIARDAGATAIEFINEIDDEELPLGIGVLFPYIERTYLFDIGIPVPIQNSLVGCKCNDKHDECCDHRRRCVCQANLGNGPAYTTEGLFTFNTEAEIIECNNFCVCPPKCLNRSAQYPRQIPVQIFKTEKRGWGARMPVDLVRGQIVGLYTGYRREDADKLSGSRASYCFDLDVNEAPDEDPPENAYSVDAYACGNWTRFLNHSCSPNLQIISVVYDTKPEDNMPYLAVVAAKNIPAYTELTFDYNPAHQMEFERKRYREKTESKKKKGKTHTRCLCGTSNCRGWLSVVA
ncbi:SET domain-containing protein [Mycena pura]|uniref:SET domain-containing protein n=1 Tax=Mycena pura TaxID=153505 RepID=A0AAD6V3N6_9AGAR|nr:SET domain-containing protein [Mycena pura]